MQSMQATLSSSQRTMTEETRKQVAGYVTKAKEDLRVIFQTEGSRLRKVQQTLPPDVKETSQKINGSRISGPSAASVDCEAIKQKYIDRTLRTQLATNEFRKALVEKVTAELAKSLIQRKDAQIIKGIEECEPEVKGDFSKSLLLQSAAFRAILEPKRSNSSPNLTTSNGATRTPPPSDKEKAPKDDDRDMIRQQPPKDSRAEEGCSLM